MQNTGTRLWLLLWKAYDSVREHAERNIEELGIGLSDFGVLEMLLHKGPTAVNTIGAKLRLTSGSITAAVDRLERKGLVERRADPGDRRTRMVYLTLAGRKLISCAFADHEKAMEKAVSVLNPEERAEAAQLLKKLGLGAQRMLQGGAGLTPAPESSPVSRRSGSGPRASRNR